MRREVWSATIRYARPPETEAPWSILTPCKARAAGRRGRAPRVAVQQIDRTHQKSQHPLLILVAAAVAVAAEPNLHQPPEQLVERLVTVALVCILFDGGLRMGCRSFTPPTTPIAMVGVLGTVLTAAAAAAFMHYAFDLPWYPALLDATAISPTDPAAVFSVLGQREGTKLKGESGANDPVGIALIASLITAGALSVGTLLPSSRPRRGQSSAHRDCAQVGRVRNCAAEAHSQTTFVMISAW